MINREDFLSALKKDKREPVSIQVKYFNSNKIITYFPKDFDRVKFPVRKLTIQYEKRSGGSIYLSDIGETVYRDRKKVKGK